ncbi:MarR family transcriptional regulator [Microbacterium sp. STN6]|uniref:MarR family winged helix-turn-helix transcriptional regulator n=1 Tax=Microbacterium sp. STN6 TaxID=2995588 RepID=UPI002260C826|nr:MarR family transcriptional regulator [Microbacterium sp. STN6]MCX7522650.1 MarR family transcriptional regulator [Microbacterium sp. STN6]
MAERTYSSRTLSHDAMLDPRVLDPGQELVNHGDLSDDELAQVVRLMVALRAWREAEQRISLDSRSRMHLNETDMKALRFLIGAKAQHLQVTAGALSDHLGISTAATTKLLDRLAAAGHIERSPHPRDRRALTISITDRTHEEVRDSVGRQHARRYEAAVRLTAEEREVVIRFLQDVSGEPAPTEPPGPASA